jgi:spermidine synthase
MYEVVEWLNRDEKHSHRLDGIIFEEQTAVQNVKIGRLRRYGLCLLLNDRIQSTEFDEVIYHEGIVLPAYVASSRFEAVLCVGGANGGIIREVLKCPGVSRLEMIDIDRRAFEICRTHLPHMFYGVDWDRRVRLNFGEVRSLLNEVSGPFDVIFNDVADSIQGTAAVDFYTRQHFADLERRLSKDGLLVTQAGAVEHLDGSFFASVGRTLSELFRYVTPYLLDIPSYGLPWGFLVASNTPVFPDTCMLPARLGALTAMPTTYDLESHLRMFNLPRLIRARLQSEGRIITSGKPMLTFGRAEAP